MTALAFMFATAFLGQGHRSATGLRRVILPVRKRLSAFGDSDRSRIGAGLPVWHRIWVGEGVNQARLLLLGMLLGAFTIGVLGPFDLCLAASVPYARDSGDVNHVIAVVVTMLGLILVGAFVTLCVLDSISRHVVADRPGKFGPKVPAVGKWTHRPSLIAGSCFQQTS